MPQWIGKLSCTPPNCSNSVLSLVDHKKIIVYYHWILLSSRTAWRPNAPNMLLKHTETVREGVYHTQIRPGEHDIRAISGQWLNIAGYQESFIRITPVLMCSLLMRKSNVHNIHYVNYGNSPFAAYQTDPQRLHYLHQGVIVWNIDIIYTLDKIMNTTGHFNNWQKWRSQEMYYPDL